MVFRLVGYTVWCFVGVAILYATYILISSISATWQQWNNLKLHNGSSHMSVIFKWTMIPADLPIAKQLGSDNCSAKGIPQIICFSRHARKVSGAADSTHLTFLGTSTGLPQRIWVSRHEWPCPFARVCALADWVCAAQNFNPCPSVQSLPSCGTTHSLEFTGRRTKSIFQ